MLDKNMVIIQGYRCCYATISHPICKKFATGCGQNDRQRGLQDLTLPTKLQVAIDLFEKYNN